MDINSESPFCDFKAVMIAEVSTISPRDVFTSIAPRFYERVFFR